LRPVPVGNGANAARRAAADGALGIRVQDPEWIWLKPKLGTGFWLRNRHESLLIGVKGKVPAPAPGEQPPSVIEADVGRHCEKPQHFPKLIEAMFPTTPRLEMFARTLRPGWDVWGNEALFSLPANDSFGTGWGQGDSFGIRARELAGWIPISRHLPPFSAPKTSPR
jgi:hypothetical protein